MSLQDIIISQNKLNNFETYAMHLCEEAGKQDEKTRTIIVKRMDLIYNDKECQVLNFTDITTYKRLK